MTSRANGIDENYKNASESSLHFNAENSISYFWVLGNYFGNMPIFGQMPYSWERGVYLKVLERVLGKTSFKKFFLMD